MDTVVTEVVSWLMEAGEQIKVSLNSTINVSEKSNRKDLVTNIDKETQDFLIKKVKQFDPEAKVLAEEDGLDHADISKGRFYIIDPIDGTLNFVLERANFCIMLAIYEDGEGKYGFIYDVMRDELYWGNKELGVYCNDKQLPQPDNISLEEGLVGLNAYMYANNVHHAYDIGELSMGMRCSGCAGLEMIAIVKGQHNAYISNLSPWDYAAGNVLLDALDFRYSNEKGEPLQFDGREIFFGGTKQTYKQMMAIIQEK